MPSSRHHSIVSLMRLFEPRFGAKSWAGWRVVVKAIFGEELAASELDTFRALTGRSVAPTSPAREAWLVVGRRGRQEQHRGARGGLPHDVSVVSPGAR